jgi:hypothetical protein
VVVEIDGISSSKSSVVISRHAYIPPLDCVSPQHRKPWQGRSSRSKIAPESIHDHVDFWEVQVLHVLLRMGNRTSRILKPAVWGRSLVHSDNRGNVWPATATPVVHVEPRRIFLVTAGDRSPAWLACKERVETGALNCGRATMCDVLKAYRRALFCHTFFSIIFPKPPSPLLHEGGDTPPPSPRLPRPPN